ncbi:MAG: hypothetical protein A2W99_16145 [Bacteroidetes bacterium GWF2_33_16]|nr:MAG: hypothetical protein A2X00_15490 [Bacteroidetes bacterium GWE2_32_14]OFY02433.1 MAG: hypothetical protein A2W99_16145 [Bacteroidetes bacterium GWF2_33_16]
MELKDWIFTVGFEIGFTYRKMTYWKAPSISLPCMIVDTFGKRHEMVEILLTDYISDKLQYIRLEDIHEVNKSIFTLDSKTRLESMRTQEYRNDWPFFYRIKTGELIGFNAYSPINFTYDFDIKPSDVLEVVSFADALKEKYKVIKNHERLISYILLDNFQDLQMIIQNNIGENKDIEAIVYKDKILK